MQHIQIGGKKEKKKKEQKRKIGMKKAR